MGPDPYNGLLSVQVLPLANASLQEAPPYGEASFVGYVSGASIFPDSGKTMSLLSLNSNLETPQDS